MDKVWEELYTEACRLQGEKKLSRYMRVGSVAAALITTNGNVYSGLSLANSCAVGMCAERNAIGTMLTNGESEISKIIAVKDNGKIISPCGICQECMRQLGDYSKNIQVMMSNQEIKTLGELTDEWWGNQDNE